MERETSESMHEGLMEAFHRIRRVNISAMMEISQSEFWALEIIAKYQRENPKREGIYVSALARKLRIASSQTSRMLKGLEERRLVGRSIDMKDRRNTYVFLTGEGQEIRQKTKQRMMSYMEDVWNQMGEEKVQKLIQLCNEMADTMESELKRRVEAGSE